MAVSVKIISGNDQPQGGQGIVSIAGARGLTAANKIGSNNTVSPFPPLLTTQIDQTIAVINAKMDGRYSLKQAYDANQPSGVAIYPV
tara:strand:- start:1654 stop:1914 length:261 start_codon:yes stop_codon:yes gene_type:complete